MQTKSIKENYVKVEWFDASGLTLESKEWLTKDEAVEVAEKRYNERCISVGIILENNKKYIVIGATNCYGVYSDCLVIPKGMVHKITKLK